MKSEQAIKRGAAWTAPVGLAGIAGRILTGALALLLIAAAFGGRAWAITGGQVDERNTYSEVGALVFFPPGREPFMGSGTLIHPRVLLTAGHNTDTFRAHPWLLPFACVSFGKDALDPATWLEIETVITHPGFRNTGMNNPHLNDVGVIILKQPVVNVTPAQLPPYAGFQTALAVVPTTLPSAFSFSRWA